MDKCKKMMDKVDKGCNLWCKSDNLDAGFVA